jgi:hypothetical protein
MKLRTGDWMMSRRKHDYKTSGVHFLVGGVKSLSDWQSFPVLGSASELKAEEPDWWILPDNTLAAVFRDNRRSGFLYRAFSTDDGRTWSTPVKTNFPDATSKISGLRLKRWPLRPRLESQPEEARSAHALDQRRRPRLHQDALPRRRSSHRLPARHRARRQPLHRLRRRQTNRRTAESEAQ